MEAALCEECSGVVDEYISWSYVLDDITDEKTNLTPLMKAAKNGHDQCITRVLESGKHAGGDPQEDPVSIDFERGAPFCSHSSIDVNVDSQVGAFVNSDSQQVVGVNTKSQTGTPIGSQTGAHMSIHIKSEADVNICSEAGSHVNTGSQAAVGVTTQNSSEVEGKVNVNATCEHKEGIGIPHDMYEYAECCTALHYAAHCGYDKCVDVLIKGGADVDQTVADMNGWTALHHAIRFGNDQCVELLINAGADLNIQDTEYGDTLLHAAIREQRYKSAELLLQAGADVNISNPCGFTPLHRAALCENSKFVEALIQRGADINCANEHTPLVHWTYRNGPTGLTPLHMTAISKYQSEKCVEVLIKAGAELNKQDDKGMTALYRSVSFNKTECVSLLIQAGADVNIETCDGDTALHIAAKEGRNIILGILRKSGVDMNSLQALSREVVRSRLIELNPQSNLFTLVPLVTVPPYSVCLPSTFPSQELPDEVHSFLLYGASPSTQLSSAANESAQ